MSTWMHNKRALMKPKSEDDPYDLNAEAPAGRELDALIAEKVMGEAVTWLRTALLARVPHHAVDGQRSLAALPHYSTDIAAAWQVVDRLRAQGYGIILSDVRAGFWTCEIDRSSWRGSEVWSGETAPLAICRAALAALSADPTPRDA